MSEEGTLTIRSGSQTGMSEAMVKGTESKGAAQAEILSGEELAKLNELKEG